MLFSLLHGGGINAGDFLLRLAAVAFVVFLTMPVHEAAHAWMAKKLGDDTGWMHGRLTLNPLKHIDWIGALLILVVGFGYAKPVPVNVRNFRKPQRDMALTALAGPVSNLLMATVCSFAKNLVRYIAYKLLFAGNLSDTGLDALGLVANFFYFAAFINISLAVFNLLPIPPLDGSRLLTAFLPARIWYKIMQYETYIRYGLLALLLFGVLTAPLQWLAGGVESGINFLTGLPFRPDASLPPAFYQ
ncbi:MAG: site-2 protease family protein [Oscillospiraceae bacterium]|jgi:Zn-dependent protease|nr:site-2 protease family protein [Oscillospiraceae bacterium]